MSRKSGFPRGVEGLAAKIGSTIAREARETRVAGSILVKALRHYADRRNPAPTARETLFLRAHSRDLLKIVPMIVMFPTPIPYIELALLLKTLGVGALLPSDRELEIPEGHERSASGRPVREDI
jgi:hypothetical protein